MEYENFIISTFQKTHYINAAWKAAPPANLLLSEYVENEWVAMQTRVGLASDVTDINPRDNLYINRLAVFCNFADGLILRRGALSVSFGLDKAGRAFPRYGTISVNVPIFNTWFECNKFVSDKEALGLDITEADSLNLLTRLTSFGLAGGYPSYSTVQINPALANMGNPGNPDPGACNFIIDIAAEVRHSYNM